MASGCSVGAVLRFGGRFRLLVLPILRVAEANVGRYGGEDGADLALELLRLVNVRDGLGGLKGVVFVDGD